MSGGMNLSYQSFNFGAFGFNFSASQISAGISNAGASGGAQILSFASSFSIGQMSMSTQSMIASKGGFATDIAPLPAPVPQRAGPPAGKGLATDPPGWPKGSVRTAGGYTVVPEGGTKWKIFNPGAKPGDKADTFVHGDPHVTEKDGGRWDFTKNSDFVLPDGTRINAKTSSEKGRSVTTGLEITNGADHVSVTGVNGKPATSAVKHDGYEWRAQHMASNPNRDTFKLGGDGDDWYLVRGGQNKGEITGAYYDNKNQTYQQKVDGKAYTVDPKLRPPIGSDAWGNQVRTDALDFISGRMGLPPWTARMIGEQFHQDHAYTQLYNNLARMAPYASPFGGIYGMMNGFGGMFDAMNGMSDALESLRSLQAMQLGHRGAFLY